jgi:hypothetical protein
MQKENRFFFSFSNGSNFPEGESYNIFAKNDRFCGKYCGGGGGSGINRELLRQSK